MRATLVASACIGAIGRLARLAPNAPHQLPLNTSHRTSRARRLIALVVLGTTGGVSSSCASRDSSLPLERMVVVIPVGNESPALYGIVRNLSTVDDSIVGVEVELAERAGLFSSREHLLPTDGAPAGALGNRSSEVSIAVRAGKTLRLSPDGLHALLSGLRRPLVRGDSTRVTLRFAHGAPRSAPARVIAYADLDSILSPELSIEAVRNVAARFSAVHDEGHADSVVAPSADEGRVLYRANGCGACHGPDGEGDGPVGKTLRPPPRDFRDAMAFKNGTDVASIAQTIATGLMSGGAMPRFTHLTNSERASLALYVISLRNSTNSLRQLRDTL